MIEVSYAQFDQIIAEARYAFDYAWEHYDLLRSRTPHYTLYGPRAYATGAISPGARKRELILRTKTRRREYTAYELDENFQPLFTEHYRDYEKISSTYVHFELNGIHYARPFFRNEKRIYTDTIHLIKYENGKPVFWAESSRTHLTIEYFEYTSASDVIATSYTYYPTRVLSETGHPIDRNAPFNAYNSPVRFGVYEKTWNPIDFSSFFR